MMELSLKADIEILLEKSTLVGHNDVRLDNNELINLQGPDSTIDESMRTLEIVHAQAESIKKLFFQNNKDNQQQILALLVDSLGVGGQISRTSSLSLIETGNIAKLIETIRDNYTDHAQHGYYISLILLNGYIRLFWRHLPLSQVRVLREWTSKTRLGENQLGGAVARAPMVYGRIRQLVEAVHNQTTHILAADIVERIDNGYNPEVNEDKEELKKEVSRFGFPADLSETLDKIDQKFSEAHDAFDFKGCLDLIRAFTERLYRSILDTYDSDGRKIDEKDSEAVAKFLENKGLISDHFAAMIAQLRHFLSDQGSHRIKSREEDARLSKNMVIEMSLYLLRRFAHH